MTRTERKLSKAVRQAADCAGKPWPITIVPGDAAPEIVGESYHWITPAGKRVRWPNAYRRAWGKPLYSPSTLRIRVGRGWLEAQGLVPTLDHILAGQLCGPQPKPRKKPVRLAALIEQARAEIGPISRVLFDAEGGFREPSAN